MMFKPNRFTKAALALATSAALTLGMSACGSDANVVSHNISQDADNFKILRRVVFYNGITDQYILEIDGYCSIGGADRPDEIAVTCKLPDGTYEKHYLSKSDNVTWFAQQLKPSNESASQYKVIFKPSTILPDIEGR